MRETAKAAVKWIGATVGIAATFSAFFLTAGAYGSRLDSAEDALKEQKAALDARRAVDEQQNERLKAEEIHRSYVERALIRLEATATRTEAKIEAILLAPALPPTPAPKRAK